ncbi:hypothetical protein [Lentzea flaviverrucosa]|uniref:Uncharacterized protein n=1 Tax=Lentzea flaviverrucosa TaxID=200379 RepID=A0A1H9EL10_9PSEU|nr:hypothetical protein [Lentzea flaviverrucosa]RDI35464.1 hypothetical protein DFR72_1011215 [Lentzea flaviverrucosa]SEQ25903.1 hypothetical protein SAMN05216195_1022 [Lentzea flaviverrucosa]
MIDEDERSSGYTEEQVQEILAQHADLLDSMDENPRYVNCPRCPEDLYDNHCPLCLGSAVVGP